MFLLYNGKESDSREVRLVNRVNDVHRELVRCNPVRILRAHLHDNDAADFLENMPLELWEGTNGFRDQFEVLYMKVPARMYLEIELEADTYRSKARYRSIPEATAVFVSAVFALAGV
jgi:hypothetical protein